MNIMRIFSFLISIIIFMMGSSAWTETLQYHSAPFLGHATEKTDLSLKVALESHPEGSFYSLKVIQGSEIPPVILDVVEKDSREKEARLYTGTSSENQIFTLQMRTEAALLTVANPDGKTGSFFLLPDGKELPSLPLYIQPPITGKTTSLSTLNFIDAYPFWSGESVALGYTLIPSSHRIFLRYFPNLRADIAWKVCQAKRPSSATVALMEGQQGDCPLLLSRIESLQKKNAWVDFKMTTRQEASGFKDIIGCAQGMKSALDCRKMQSVFDSKKNIRKTIFDVTQ